MNSYQALLLLSLQEDTDISDMGGTYVGLFENKFTNATWHLITAPQIYAKKFKWQNEKLNFNNTSDSDGYNNCYNLENITQFPAIDYCVNFSFNNFNDYYLPSIYELRFINKKTAVLKNDYYWSSSEYDGMNCFTHTDSLISQMNKTKFAIAHPIRRIVLKK